MVGARLPRTSFFDDYSIMSRECLADNATHAACGLFDILGFEYAVSGPKFLPFQPAFKLLGLKLDLRSVDSGVVEIHHTEERRADLVATIERILREGALTSREAESLRGRLVWFNSYIFGRVAKKALKVIRERTSERGSQRDLSPGLREALRALLCQVKDPAPLTVSTRSHDSWFIFTGSL